MIPTVADERAQTIRGQAKRWREDGLITAEQEREIRERYTTPWRSYGLFAWLLFFFLACCAVGAFHVVLDLAHGPTAVAGIAAIVIAEVLIAKKWFGTGVEGGLWLAGLFSLIASLPSEGKPEAILLFAAACALAGVRVRNPLFGALAAVLVVMYLDVKRYETAAVASAIAIGVVALLALLREWKRPSTEWLWILLLALPLTVSAVKWELTVPVLLPAAVVLAAAGLWMRHHAPLVVGGLALALAIDRLFQQSPLALELLLAIAGVLCLGFALAISRVLRGRTRGLVATPMRLTSADDAIQLASVVVAAPHEPSQAPTGRVQGSGDFGGAGATGDL